jgi:hypothetical protein
VCLTVFVNCDARGDWSIPLFVHGGAIWVRLLSLRYKRGGGLVENFGGMKNLENFMQVELSGISRWLDF